MTPVCTYTAAPGQSSVRTRREWPISCVTTCGDNVTTTVHSFFKTKKSIYTVNAHARQTFNTHHIQRFVKKNIHTTHLFSNSLTLHSLSYLQPLSFTKQAKQGDKPRVYSPLFYHMIRITATICITTIS